jgi:hypothetical protein
MPFSFPASPAVGATSTQNGREYRYAGNNTWELVAASGGLSWSSVPASATASGTAGQIAYDGDFLYVATAANTWERAALSTWVPFAPTAIAGLQAWYDASDASTLYDATTGGSLVAVNGAVARWEDKSGNARHATQSTSGFRPVRKTAQQNGLGAIEFTGSSSQRLEVSGSASTLNFLHGSTYTLFCVVRAGLTSAPNVLNPIVSTITTFSGLPGVAIYHDDRSGIPRSNRIGHTVVNSSESILGWTTADNFFPANAFGVLSMTGDMNSGTAAGRTTVYNTAGVSESPASTSGSASTASSQSDFTIGALSEQFFLTGQFAEIVIYNSVLSSTDRDMVRVYLKTKWGIA